MTTDTTARVSGTIKALRAAFERWMIEDVKCVVGSSDSYPAGIERSYWQAWLACAAAIQPDPEQVDHPADAGNMIQPDPATEDACPCCGGSGLYGDAARRAMEGQPEPQPVTWAVAVLARKDPKIGYRMRLSHAASEDEAIGESMRFFQELDPGWEIMQPAALPIPAAPSSAGTVSDEAAAPDHEPFEIEGIYNHYGGLSVKRENGQDFWAIEDWNGIDWVPCPPFVAAALRALRRESE